MKLRDAVTEVIKGRTKYRAAKMLGLASSVSFNNYLRGRKCSLKVADAFKAEFGITIDEEDIHDPIRAPRDIK